MFGVYPEAGRGLASCVRLHPRRQRLVPDHFIPIPKLSLQPGLGAAPVPVLQLKVKWMRVEKNPGPVFVPPW